MPGDEHLRGEAVKMCARDGLAPIRALSPHYNLLERDYERELAAEFERLDAV